VIQFHQEQSQTSLTEPQLSEVAASDLLADPEIRADHRHGLAGDAGALAGAVAGPLTGARHRRDFSHRF